MKDWIDMGSDLNSYGTIEIDNYISETTALKSTEDSSDLPQKSARIWEISYYKEYFDIDTETVISRIKKALNPYNKSRFFDSETPDLYTPFWTVTTFIFILAATSNYGSYYKSEDIYYTHAPRLLSAATYIYIQAIAVPVACYFLLRSEGSKINLLEIMSLYGYSFLSFLPACLICIYPDSMLRWIILGFASV